MEYDAATLALEYCRDLDKGIAMPVPLNYFPGDDPAKPPQGRWRAHANLFFSNWMNFYVNQETPFELENIGGHI